ncbi:MAG: DUF6597 domain-containing transcriptional factor, partial [Bacteroidota bacterium]
MSKSIRQLYRPIQPSLLHAPEDHVVYAEHVPHPALAEWIYCFWELKSMQPLQEDFCYRVVVDGCIDILVELSHPQDNFITGFSTSYVEFPIGQQFHYRGIRFLPGAFPLIFGIRASELTNQFFSLHDVVPDLAKLITDQLRADHSMAGSIELLETFFLK